MMSWSEGDNVRREAQTGAGFALALIAALDSDDYEAAATILTDAQREPSVFAATTGLLHSAARQLVALNIYDSVQEWVQATAEVVNGLTDR